MREVTRFLKKGMKLFHFLGQQGKMPP